MSKRIILINYDNGSRWPVLPQNLTTLAAALMYDGHKVQIIDFNLTKQPYDSLEDRLKGVDIVGLGFISGYWPHIQAMQIVEAVHSCNPAGTRFKFIIGGHGPSAAPEHYERVTGADAVFVGSADISLPYWIAGGCKESGIIPSMGFDNSLNPCKAYPQGSHLDVYKRIRFPTTRGDEFAIQILSGRGCPYACSFCFRTDKKFMHYEIDDICDNIEKLYRDHQITHFQFSDELFMSDSKFIHAMCEALIQKSRVLDRQLHFDCNGRLNQASLENLLIMKRAGFRYINYGCEAMDNNVLEKMNKKQTVGDIYTGIQNTIDAGLSPGLNFMWGNPGDGTDTLEKAKTFILEHSDYCELRTIRPVTPYPGSPLFYDLIQEGRLDTDDPVGHFYREFKNPDSFSFHWIEGIDNREANLLLYKANKSLLVDYHNQQRNRALIQAAQIALDKKADFRGWRDV